ncbi:F0F1 ATP synthase subunit B [Salinicoccus sp. ID82-1]|uniref:ATP synthase subunit b n=1 Tax=Salinicoccus cyprini TaxID=2493691 RepID=A0A558ASJ9_9STAP|nr:F0F1 ATP synthase subunit B [Salinicoccus cyprini]MCG1009898.1 F0F1 ATP synthase subunit B [Salinicoccus sp. ID82-1]TVT27241.1 F0F1 ATP synthase subunit B [Salinicoccus cyprini]
MEFLILGATDTVPAAIGNSLIQLAAFIVLLLVLSYFVWKPLKKVMDEREQLIHSEIDDAEQRRMEAVSLKEENEAVLRNTQAEISEMMDNAKEQAKKEQEAIIHDANTRANQMMEDAKADIEREKQKAIRDINDQVADISVLIAEKMISKEINKQDQKDLVARYLQEAGGK